MARNIESTLQSNCVKWFRLQYPNLARNLFAIPNGGQRTFTQAVTLKREGVVAGVSDLCFAYPCPPLFHGLFIEMKVGKNDQTEHQRKFQIAIERFGYLYKVVRTFDEFKFLIELYMTGQIKNE